MPEIDTTSGPQLCEECVDIIAWLRVERRLDEKTIITVVRVSQEHGG